MAFDNSFTAVVGATYTAAQYNTHVRDNFTAVWVYTAAGDIAYATSSTALARLAKGSTAYQTLRMNAGLTAPEWGGWIAGKITRVTNQSISTATLTNINFTAASITRLLTWSSGDDTKLTIGAAGLYIYGFTYASDGGSGYREANVLLNGATLLETRYPTAAGETTYITGVDIKGFAAGEYLQLQVKHNESGSIDIRKASLFAVFAGA